MQSGFYRAVWRWHFYAGLIVLPVLVWLAVTGSLYLYKPDIERAVYGDWIQLGAPAEPMPVAGMIERVAEASGGRVTQVSRPASADESWRMTVEMADGVRRTAFVHPGDGRILGTTHFGGVMATVMELHSLAITGPAGNVLIEIVAGWAIILVITGFYLWWPRKGQKALALRGKPRERRFWRDFHASVGALVGAIILFLAVTGLPWSFFWGERLNEAIESAGIGRLAPPALQPTQTAMHDGHDHGQQDPAAHADHKTDPEQATLPWPVQNADPPRITGNGDVGADRVLAAAAERGMAPPYTLNLPRNPAMPYSINYMAKRVGDMRLIHVEPASGRVLQDEAYEDFGWGAQVVGWGIMTHQGETYGEPNRIVMLIGCIGVLLLAMSAPILWWKRRRKGRIDAPPRGEARQMRIVAAMMIVGGLLLPLTGLTMLAAWLGELAWRRMRPVAEG